MGNCPINYRCLYEPNWPPDQMIPLFGIVGATVIIIVLLIVWATTRGNKA